VATSAARFSAAFFPETFTRRSCQPLDALIAPSIFGLMIEPNINAGRIWHTRFKQQSLSEPFCVAFVNGGEKFPKIVGQKFPTLF
jgi:hypothetical protein